MNDENPDRELITLRMYHEMIVRVTEYARYLMDDGVTREEIMAAFDSIVADMARMRVGQRLWCWKRLRKLRA